MLNSNQFFLLSRDKLSPYNLLLYKITFSTPSVDWANKMLCASGTWTTYLSESLLSSDSSTIYSFFIYGSTQYAYFASFLVSDGTVTGTRYKSSISWGYVFGSALSGGYVIATVSCPPASKFKYAERNKIL